MTAVIFDCDGTLVDSEPLARTAWERALAPYGYELTDADADRRITYTAVKNRITGLRAQQDQRPATDPAGRRPDPASPPGRSAARDTSRAYLAGASAFSLDALTGPGTQADHA